MKSADLHIHSEYSDSTFSVEEIFKIAKSHNLDCLSLTDHDTVKGIKLSLALAKEFDIEFIPGVEITTEFEGKEVHILGYFVDVENKEFLEFLKQIQEQRKERVYEMSKKLAALGIEISPQEVFNKAKESCVTRLHVAEVLIEKGVVKDLKEAFKNYIGDKAPCYVARFKFSPFKAIQILRRMKAIPVLAHPFRSNADQILDDLVQAGLLGIEVFYPDQRHLTDYYIKIAKKYSLLITGGSDSHGNAKPKDYLGFIKLPYEYVRKLKEKRDSL